MYKFQSSFKRQKNLQLTPHGDDSQHHPRGPLGQVLDEDQRHEGGHEDQIGLLQAQGAFPVDADHPHHAKVPHAQRQGYVVHGHVVCF